MLRDICVFSFLLILLITGSCRKDKLHLQKVQQLASNTDARLNRIRFISDKVCIVAGGEKWLKSEMLRSADGGYTWTNATSQDAEKGMYGMCVSPDGTIYLTGPDSDVLISKDSGLTWQFKRINDWLLYLAISFPSKDTGILINTTVQEFSTITEVDANFNVLSYQHFRFGLNDIHMVSPSTGYVIGYGVVMKTTDYRHTWQFQNIVGDNFMAIDVHGDELWVCGYNGSIYHSTNGGGHWDRLRNGNDITLPHYHLYSIVFKDALNGWAVGESGKVIHTDDGGHHWAEYEQFTSNSLRSIALCPNGDLLVAGDKGTLYRIVP